MSSHPVALAQDPAVPQRDQLMDLDAIARRLTMRIGRNGPVSIGSCGLGCISYRAGKRLRVVYRLEIDGRDLLLAASTFRSSSRGERAYRKAKEKACSTGPFRPIVYDAGLETVFWVFPNDRRIRNLSAVADAHDDVTRLVNGSWARSRLVDYYPEASAVMGCLDDSGRVVAYAKVNAGDEGERTHRIQEALARLACGSRLRIARPLAYSRRYRTLVVEPIVGESIRRLTGPRLLAGLHAYGAALATLHSMPPVGGGRGVRDALGRLQRKADGLRMVRPDVDDAVSELLDELGARWEEGGAEPVLVHGDTNENNAILQGDRIALIDFDRASIGAAGSDIGNFLGLLRYFRLLGFISPRSERTRAAAFVDGYSSVSPLPLRESLRVNESAALAERAIRAVTRLRTSALRRVPALLQEARELLR